MGQSLNSTIDLRSLLSEKNNLPQMGLKLTYLTNHLGGLMGKAQQKIRCKAKLIIVIVCSLYHHVVS